MLTSHRCKNVLTCFTFLLMNDLDKCFSDFIHCIIISLRNSINLIILTNCWDKIVLSVFGKCSSRAITMQLAGIRKHKYYKKAIQCSNNNNNSKDIFLFYQHIEYNSYYRIVHFYTGMT